MVRGHRGKKIRVERGHKGQAVIIRLRFFLIVNIDSVDAGFSARKAVRNGVIEGRSADQPSGG